ncbi:AAA family ATPase [Dyella jejuensis]|uniref:AAA family ATPase n=1 Tax=Dyella jejuensis TaxID=1432009 RepID=A0ABW8JJM4_9GAMM
MSREHPFSREVTQNIDGAAVSSNVHARSCHNHPVSTKSSRAIRPDLAEPWHRENLHARYDYHTEITGPEAALILGWSADQLKTHGGHPHRVSDPSTCGKGAKVVLMGDAQQLSPVAAGQAFRLFRDALGEVELTEIRRQKDVQDVRTSEVFIYAHAGKERGAVSRDAEQSLGAGILARLEARGRIERTDTKVEAMAQLVQDYFDSPLEPADKLVMGSTNADAAQLNRVVRERLIAGGLFIRKSSSAVEARAAPD